MYAIQKAHKSWLDIHYDTVKLAKQTLQNDTAHWFALLVMQCDYCVILVGWIYIYIKQDLSTYGCHVPFQPTSVRVNNSFINKKYNITWNVFDTHMVRKQLFVSWWNIYLCSTDLCINLQTCAYQYMNIQYWWTKQVTKLYLN